MLIRPRLIILSLSMMISAKAIELFVNKLVQEAILEGKEHESKS